MGDDPAVRREGGVSRQEDSLNRMIMSGKDYEGARGGKVTHKYTQISKTHTLLWTPHHTSSSNQRARPELIQVL